MSSKISNRDVELQFTFFNKDAFSKNKIFRLDSFRDITILKEVKKEFYFIDNVFIKDVGVSRDKFYYEIVASGVIEGIRLSGSTSSFYKEALSDRVLLISQGIRDFYQYLINNKEDELFEHLIWSQCKFRIAHRYNELIEFNYNLFNETYVNARIHNRNLIDIFNECMKWADSFNFKEVAY